ANALWRSSKTTEEMEARLHQAEDDRKQAMVLFELSRLATLGTDVESDLDGAAMMLAGALGHDAVGIWALSEHKLRRRAATGYDKGTSEALVDEADTVLATVLREKRAARGSFTELRTMPSWAPPRGPNFLVTPIGALGVLVTARASGPYSEDDADFSLSVGEYLVGLLQRSTSTDVVDQGVAAERRKIAQELHDGLAQELTGVVLALEGCQRALDKDPALLGPQLAKASRDARATLMDVPQRGGSRTLRRRRHARARRGRGRAPRRPQRAGQGQHRSFEHPLHVGVDAPGVRGELRAPLHRRRRPHRDDRRNRTARRLFREAVRPMNEKRRIRVLIVDDHAVVRSGLRTILETEPDIEIVGEAGDGHAALELA